MSQIDETRAFRPVNIALLTVSDRRSLAEDTSGDLLQQRLIDAGHVLAARVLLKDDLPAIIAQLTAWIDDPEVDCVITTGGTGLTGRDVMPEAFAAVVEKDIPGFGELFRWISFQKIGTSTIQSRATGGLARGTYLFALPCSTSACRDGWDEILRWQLDARHKPCNLVELMPRLREHEGA